MTFNFACPNDKRLDQTGFEIVTKRKPKEQKTTDVPSFGDDTSHLGVHNQMW